MDLQELLKYKGIGGMRRAVFTLLLLAVGAIVSGCGNVGSSVIPPPAGFLLTTPTDSATIVGTRPTLRWTKSTGVLQYHVQFSEDAEFKNIFPHFDSTYPVAADTTSYTVMSGLTTSVTYYWRVRAINKGGVTYASNGPFRFLTTLSTSTLSGFELGSPADGAVNVSVTPLLIWGDETGENGYLITINTAPTITGYLCNALVSPDTTSYLVSASSCSLAPGTKYYWWVRATFNEGDPVIALNAPFSFTTASTSSLPSFTLTEPADGITSVGTSTTLQWTDIAGETGYRVSIDTNAALATPFNFPDIPSGTTSLLVTSATYSLVPGTTYYWNVMALGLSIPASNGPFSFTP